MKISQRARRERTRPNLTEMTPSRKMRARRKKELTKPLKRLRRRLRPKKRRSTLTRNVFQAKRRRAMTRLRIE